MPEGKLDRKRLVQLLRQTGFKGKALRDAYAIVMRESGGNPRAHNPNRATGDDSYGLAQVNMLGSMGPARRKQYGLKSNEDLYDPATSARVMYQMSGGGKNFGPWGVGASAYRKTAPLDYSGFPGAGDAGPGQQTAGRQPGPAAQDGGGLAAALLQYAQTSGGSGVEGILQALGQREDPVPAARLAPDQPGRAIPSHGSYDLSKYGGSPIQGSYTPLGRPGQGTHSYSEGPNNWQSDSSYDLGVPKGTPVYAMAPGVIGTRFGPLAESGRFAGNRLTLEGRNNAFYYAHLSRYAEGIKPGARVKRGQLLGYSGVAGSPHLHLGIKNL